MTLRKSILLILGLGMIAALVACSSSSSTPPAPTIAITANSGGYTTPQVVGNNTFGTFSVTVTSNGTPSGNATVTFTSPSAADGTFAGATTTATATTNASGVATSPTFSSGTAAGPYMVTATTTEATTSAIFSLTNNAGAAAAIAASQPASGSESAAVSTAFGALSVLVSDSDGNPVAGQAVTFTVTAGGSGATGSFATTGTTDAETTGNNGIATTSQTLTANATLGTFTATADFTGDTGSPATFTLTNTAVATAPLAAGNYVFSANGTNVNGAYSWAGVFTVTTNGGTSTITTGEQDYSDFGETAFISAEPITGGTVAGVGGGDTNLLITLNFTDSYINSGAGSLTLDVAMESTTNGQLLEYDNWGSGSGELRLQTSTAAPSAGYAFYLSGFDDPNGFPLVVGGVLNANSATGSGSVFDVNDGGTLSSDQLFSATSLTGPDTLGLVTFTLNPSAGGTVIVDGYIVDSTRIKLVENWGDGFGTMAGEARGQGANTRTFSSSSISGSTYVILTEGNDVNGAVDVAGMLTFNSDGTVSGNLSFNDLAATNPAQGGAAITGGTYTIDASGTGNDGGTGRVTVTGVTDGATFSYDLQLYLDGNGHASVISMDANDGVAGPSQQQTSAAFTADNFTGPYSIYLTGFTTLELISIGGTGTFFGEVDTVGVLTATPSSSSAGTASGFFDSNNVQVGGVLTPDAASTVSYATTSTNGVFTVTPPSGLLTFYMTQTAGSGVIIENDNSDLAIGIAAPVQ